MYPDNVAYPFGGEGYIMIELHYDNPHEIEGDFTKIQVQLNEPPISRYL